MSSSKELEIKVKKIMYHKKLHRLLKEFLDEEVLGRCSEKEK
jgi:hypothetical protein